MSLPLTYPDLVCDVDLDPFGNETTSDLQSLVQDVTHVLVETLGSNPDDPDRGVGIVNYLSGTADSLRGLPGVIEEQLGRDDRITHVDASVEADSTREFNYIIKVNIAVSGTIIDLQYGYSDAAGLINMAP